MKRTAIYSRKSRNNKLKIVLMIVTIMIIGGVWQKTMVVKELFNNPPVGELYEVNGHDMHLYSSGVGEKTLVFITGSGTPCAYTDFYFLQDALKPYAKTISFDHPGYGWSQGTDESRDIDTLVEELQGLLAKSNHEPPYILIGHSLGAIEAIRYAQTYPDQVQGILLLDGGSPEFYSADNELISFALNRFSGGLRLTGINRIIGMLGINLPFAGEDLRYNQLPEQLKPLEKCMFNSKIGEGSNVALIKAINENAKAVMDGGYLEDIPLMILSSDSGSEWEKVQQELLHWSNESNQKTIKGGKHYLHWSNKDMVLNELLVLIGSKPS